MHVPRLALLPPFLRELFVRRTLRREPESALVMDDPSEVDAYVAGGHTPTMAGTYLFMNAHTTQVVRGCGTVLDLGCGPATLLCQVAAANPSIRFTGVDLSAPMLVEAQKTVQRLRLNNVNLVHGDITRLSPFDAASFDGVISSFALHHLPRREDLDRCFAEIKRVLRPGGALFLNDFGRLKSVKSVVHMAYLTSRDEPYLFTLDKERSMRAAFTLDDFRELAKRHWGDRVEVVGTFKVPLVVMLRTAPRPLPASVGQHFQSLREARPPSQRSDLDDLRFFFRLSGVTDDPFGPFVPLVGQMAKLRMMDFATLPVVGALHTARAARTWRVTRLAARALGLWAGWQLRRWLIPRARARHRRGFIVRLAAVLREDLGVLKGPVMKFGQMASYLTEDLPAVLQRALKPLQHRAPPLAAETIRRTVETALGRPLAQLFAEWHDTPLAAASVSQIHLARLHDGTWVVVKVRYPGLPRAVKTDFFLLRCFSPLLRALWGLPNTGELLDELEALVRTECDFQKAGAYQEEFRRAFRDDPEMIVPRVYTDLTTPDVLTMEYIEGQTYDEFKARATAEEKNRAAEIIWRMAAVSINRHGLYNADPHPGNYLFVNGKVAFLDFGFTKRFSPAFLALWKEQSLAGCAGDFDRFRDVNRRLGYERRGRRMDHRAMYETYRRLVYQAWMDDRTFRFSREFVKKEIRSLLALQRGARGALRMPVEFVAILRLLWGQHALLADLGAESNWHRIVFPLLKEPYTPV